MNIEIKDDVFKNTLSFKDLNKLLQDLTYKQRYGVFVEWTLVKDTVFYQRLDTDDRNDLEAYYNQFINDSLTTDYCVTASNTSINEHYFNIDDALLFFNQPVSILLENGLNDQYFIKAMIRAFDNSGLLQKHLDNHWLIFGNLGGCTNLENEITNRKLAFATHPKPTHLYLRCFVLLDSDRKHATDPTNHKEDFLNNNMVLYHILEKRAMENYLPDEVYENLGFETEAQKQWKNAFLHLSDTQKNFLNIPKGFSKKDDTGASIKSRTDLEDKIQALYEDISQANFEILDNGLTISKFKTEFPKYFEHETVHWQTLKNRCPSDELQSIINKIKQLL